MLLAGSPFAAIAEGFIDRTYRDDGTLVPRSDGGAIITEPAAAAKQAVSLAGEVESLCIHSDTPSALQILIEVRSALEAAGYEISAA